MLKAAEAIREVVASAILTEIRDPRVQDVTVIGVEVTPDMREATVSVSVRGDESQKQLSLRGLQNSAGFLQSKIANRIDTRYVPRLQFELNRGMENAMAVGDILGKIRREKEGVIAGESEHHPAAEDTAPAADQDPPRPPDDAIDSA
jgi:ribosome-binding factor A